MESWKLFQYICATVLPQIKHNYRTYKILQIGNAMITEERLKFLKDNKQRGDISAAVKKINPKNNPNGLSLSMANNIIAGTHWGKFGKELTDTLEEIINERKTAIDLEKAKYESTSN